MIILALQTAEQPNDLALADSSGKILCERSLAGVLKTSEKLGYYLKEMLKEAKLNIKDISLVAVCIGPGSFTGLRGGMAFAKGLCQFSKASLLATDAFDALKENIKDGTEKFAVMPVIDARGERVYLKKGQKIEVVPIKTLVQSIREDTLFIGSGVSRNEKLFQDSLRVANSKVKIHKDKKVNLLTAVGVAKCTVKRLAEGKTQPSKDEIYTFKPLYVLPPNISVKLARRSILRSSCPATAKDESLGVGGKG